MALTSIMAADESFTPQILGTLAAAGAATLVDPGEVLARLAADVPCAAGGPPANCSARCRCSATGRSRSRSASRSAARDSTRGSITDLSLLEPNKLITPNELAYIRTEIPAAAANHQGPWTLDASGLLAQPARPEARRSRRSSRRRWARTCSSARATATTVELRLDERGRMGRHSARRSRGATEAVEGRDRRAGQRLRSHRPELAALDRRRQLGVPARRRSTSSAPSSRSG